MIVPPFALDDLHLVADASVSYLNYRLKLRYRPDADERRRNGELELLSEDLQLHQTKRSKEQAGISMLA